MRATSFSLLLCFLTVHRSWGGKRCFANSANNPRDCFEIKNWEVYDCNPPGQVSKAKMTFLLEHKNDLYVSYCVSPDAQWGSEYKNYDKVCNIPVNEEFDIEVEYTYSATGSFTSFSRVIVDLFIDEEPDGVRFQSDPYFVTLTVSSCTGTGPVPTVAPTASSPTLPDSSSGTTQCGKRFCLLITCIFAFWGLMQ